MLVRLTREAGYLPRVSRMVELSESESESSGEAAESESGRSETGGARLRSEKPESDSDSPARTFRSAPVTSGGLAPASGSGAARLDSDSDSRPAASGSQATAFVPGTSGPALLELIGMDEAAWDEFSRGSAIRRARRAGFLRNVAVALGNWGVAEAVPALVRALGDTEPLVRGHAAWALGTIGTAEARAALSARAAVEADAYVREEIGAACRARRP